MPRPLLGVQQDVVGQPLPLVDLAGDQVPECRDGYLCQDVSGTGVCLPGDRPDGAECTEDGQCQGAACITEDDGFPGGHCTTLNCRNRDDCHGENTACFLGGYPSYCIRLCESDQDCRDGYSCMPVRGGQLCYPTGGTSEAPVVDQEGHQTLGINCSGEILEENAYRGMDLWRLSFDLPEGSTSFMVTPFTTGQIFAGRLTRPDGEQLDINEDYAFQALNPTIMGNLHPLLFPGAPQFADWVTAGTYKLDVLSDDEVCHLLLPKAGPGSVVDLRIHLVGIRGLDAENAPRHRDLSMVLDRFVEIYGQIGIGTRRVTYLDLPGDQAGRFAVVDSEDEAFDLVTQTTLPEPGDPDHLLTINIFFVRAFSMSGGSVLGISCGLPGAAGLHGTRGSGLIFSASMFGRDNRLLGQVLAHELGHYLGLQHTTEQDGRTTDPFEDTPSCPSISRNPERCPDVTNLMFPLAGGNHAEITEGQSSVMHANPLVKGEDGPLFPEGAE